MKAGRPKGSVRTFIITTDLGMIEDMSTSSHPNTSFNIYRAATNKYPRLFYKSAYSLEKAKKHLKELEL
ncbi:MAG: hypothetical protein DRH90_25005 [Deltaproteobacteria bacterium]|nr:MAG: hypothetical protein DRH90_25005 [Deltaproteobacteria bacterium]